MWSKKKKEEEGEEEKKENPATGDNMNTFRGYYSKWNKPHAGK